MNFLFKSLFLGLAASFSTARASCTENIFQSTKIKILHGSNSFIRKSDIHVTNQINHYGTSSSSSKETLCSLQGFIRPSTKN